MAELCRVLAIVCGASVAIHRGFNIRMEGIGRFRAITFHRMDFLRKFVWHILG